MIAYLMLFGMQFLGLVSLVLAKKFQLGVKFSASYMFQANFVSSIVACVCLFVANGFTVNTTPATYLFAFFFGLLSAASLFFTIYAYAHISLTLTSIISSAGGIIIPMLFGLLLNNEPVSFRLILSALLMLTAAVLPIIKDTSVNSGKKFIWFLAIYFVFSGLPNILSKLYTQQVNVADTLSYFFLTNVFMFFICAIGITITYLMSRKKSVFERITLPHALNSGARTGLSLIISYISIAVLRLIPVSLYAVLASSIALIGNALVSRFLFKERMNPIAKISFVLAIVSIFVGK